jgi:glycosyltransferase involved in cell wall biosynthesis
VARINVYPADLTACGHYRMIWPALALQAQGHDVHIIVPKQRGGSVGLDGFQDDAGNLISIEPPDADVIVLQRITHRQIAQAVPMLRAQGVAVVVDMDDDLTCIHPANIAWTAMHPRRGVGNAAHSWHHATQACLDATFVTVSTPALLRTYAPHGRGQVLANCVPSRYLDVPHADSPVIGWGGSVHSHPDDLQAVGSSVARLVREGHQFSVVGEGIGVRQAIGLDADPPASGLVDLPQWPNALADLGIGIVPLSDTRFNRGKSWLKGLEYMAAGVPWVASPRAEYRRLHALGVGLLADKPRDWYRHLKALATDEQRRRDMSAAGRAVAADLTIESRAWMWAEAWERAYRTQRQAASSAFSRA